MEVPPGWAFGQPSGRRRQRRLSPGPAAGAVPQGAVPERPRPVLGVVMTPHRSGAAVVPHSSIHPQGSATETRKAELPNPLAGIVPKNSYFRITWECKSSVNSALSLTRMAAALRYKCPTCGESGEHEH